MPSSRPTPRIRDGSSICLRARERGGLSGAPLKALATAVVANCGARCGEAWRSSALANRERRRRAPKSWKGANLVQLYTALVYRGPSHRSAKSCERPRGVRRGGARMSGLAEHRCALGNRRRSAESGREPRMQAVRRKRSRGSRLKSISARRERRRHLAGGGALLRYHEVPALDLRTASSRPPASSDRRGALHVCCSVHQACPVDAIVGRI